MTLAVSMVYRKLLHVSALGFRESLIVHSLENNLRVLGFSL